MSVCWLTNTEILRETWELFWERGRIKPFYWGALGEDQRAGRTMRSEVLLLTGVSPASQSLNLLGFDASSKCSLLPTPSLPLCTEAALDFFFFFCLCCLSYGHLKLCLFLEFFFLLPFFFFLNIDTLDFPNDFQQPSFPGSSAIRNLTANAGDEFNQWVGKIPWSRKWLPTPVFLHGESYGQRSLVGYSPWSSRVSDMPEYEGSSNFRASLSLLIVG